VLGFGAVVVAVLAGVGLFYGWRQVALLRRLGRRQDVPSAEDVFLRRQAWRRLVNSVLMLVLAVLMGVVLATIEQPTSQLVEQRDQLPAGERPPLPPEQKDLLRLYNGSWIAILLLLFAIVVVAGVDAWATRSYALREYRKLQADRRAMIARQVARMKQDRGGL
jgi:hypothetical protein